MFTLDSKLPTSQIDMIIVTFSVTFQFYFQAIYTTIEPYKPPL